ncbi:MAG: phosphatase PAP2 family protein [Candidatus Aminicenantaceae bacterium]
MKRIDRFYQKRKNHFTILASIILCFLFISSPNNVFSDDSENKYKLNKEYFIQFGNDLKDVLVSPTRWDKKDIFKFSAILGTGILLYTVDSDCHDWFQTHRNETSDDISGFISYFGDGGCLTGFASALYISGEIAGDKKLRKTALLSLESLLASGLLVWSIKFISGRARPYTEESYNFFHPFSLKSRYNSFPSGHSSSAFAVATVIANQSDSTLIDIFSYSLASLAAISRIHDNKHWISDVFIGSMIGYFVGKKICSLNSKENSNHVNMSFQLSPQRQSLILSIHF